MKIPYGNANFADIRSSGSFYVDKTPFLARLEDRECSSKNLVFLRPRRFGKSSLISLLEHYYDIMHAKRYDELFRGLWIYDHPTPERGTYVVLRLDFSQVNSTGTEARLEQSFLEATRSAVRAMLLRHRNRVPAFADFFRGIDGYQSASDIMANLLATVEGIGEKLYVLIDEYDTFATALLSGNEKDLYSKVTDPMGFVRAFYRTLKTGTQGAIERVFITGVTPILLDDLVTGFNIATNISNEPAFNTLAGFTDADVMQAVDELLRDNPQLASIPEVGDRDKLLSILAKYYNGYRFAEDAEERVFNSNMIMYFLQKLVSRGKFPAKMLDPNGRTDYKKLHGLWATVGPAADERRAALEAVLNTGEVWSNLVEEFGAKTSATTSQFVSLMYYTGMLTMSEDPPEGNQYRFVTPNRVIRELGWAHYTQLLEDIEGINVTDQPVGVALREMVKTGNMEPFRAVFQKNVMSVLGLRDHLHFNEQSMKMLLIGTILMSNLFYVLSEKEFAQGFNDLFICPLRNVPKAKYAWMFELKYLKADANDADIANIVVEAEAQLKRYSSDPQLVPMLTQGWELKAGTLVFVGFKRVEWREMVIER